MTNKIALDALTKIADCGETESFPGHHNGARHLRCNSCGYRWAPGIDAEIHATNCAAGIARAAIAALQVEPVPIAAIKAERRAIEYGDIVHRQVIAMRAAVVAANLESPEVGIQWIENTLDGPGHYPDIEAARELGGAQALFDAEVAEHEAFRAAHPIPPKE